MHWSEICVADLVELDFSGLVLDGKTSPEATAFFINSSTNKRCPEALKFDGQITYYDQFSGLALDGPEGDRLAEALDNKRILFLPNHGIIIVGRNVAHAFNDLYYLEQVCRAQITALSAGKPLKIISEEIAQNTFTQMQRDKDDQSSHHFAAMKRILDRETRAYVE
tara:strand:+ start:346 stop:843 length:498 start_codon:yes stop_codon:yes gene_type:complete